MSLGSLLIPALTFEEDRRQISSSLNSKDGELQQAFLNQRARRKALPTRAPRRCPPLHEGCQDACGDAELKEASCPVKEVQPLEEEGHWEGVQEETRQEHPEEPLQSKVCQEASCHPEEVHQFL